MVLWDNKQSILDHTHRYRMVGMQFFFCWFREWSRIEHLILHLKTPFSDCSHSFIMIQRFNENSFNGRLICWLCYCVCENIISNLENPSFDSLHNKNPQTTCALTYTKWCQPNQFKLLKFFMGANITVRRRQHRHSNRVHFFIYFVLSSNPFDPHFASCSPLSVSPVSLVSLTPFRIRVRPFTSLIHIHLHYNIQFKINSLRAKKSKVFLSKGGEKEAEHQRRRKRYFMVCVYHANMHWNECMPIFALVCRKNVQIQYKMKWIVWYKHLLASPMLTSPTKCKNRNRNWSKGTAHQQQR